jgi:succinate dehydrogenase/fumarate reductase flavoprotein subunit
MWNHCGMARNEQGLKEGIDKIKVLKDQALIKQFKKIPYIVDFVGC